MEYTPPYQKQKCLYSGPFCDIYHAQDSHNQPLALKVVDLDFIKKPHNFRQEIKLLRRLQHHGIVQYIDDYSAGEDHILAMPLYAGDLVAAMKNHMKRRTRFNLADPSANAVEERNEIPVDLCRLMVAQLLETVRYIHSQGVIHRDMKPANIMFRLWEELYSPVIGDFGISYDTLTPNGNEPATQKVTDIGLGYFRAPELCFGIADYGVEVDYWALGLIISYLYSREGKPANFYSDGGIERNPEINDLVLLQGTFSAFGTPDAYDSTSELYWPRMADPECHFGALNYAKRERKPTSVLLPRCSDSEVQNVFEKLTRYCGRELEMLLPCSREHTDATVTG